jgi:CRISPR-associated protein Cas1
MVSRNFRTRGCCGIGYRGMVTNGGALTVFDRVVDSTTLWGAFAQVLARANRRGPTTGTSGGMPADPAAFVGQIAARLCSEVFTGDPFTMFPIAQGGKQRVLRVPSLADRVVETALVRVLSEVVDPLLSPFAIAYRPGVSTVDAAVLAGSLHVEGFSWVVRADILSCFDSIPHAVVLDGLARQGVDEQTIRIVAGLLARMDTSGHRGVGLPQGAPASPLLANIALDVVDTALASEGLAMIRYADDVLIGAHTRQEASSHVLRVQAQLAQVGLCLNEDKTEVMSFRDGFVFLGQDIDDHEPTTPHRPAAKQVLYVARPGTAVVCRRGRVQVVRSGTVMLDAPQAQIGRIVTFGPVGVSAGVRQWALNSTVELVFLSARGKLLGTAVSGQVKFARRRIRQYDLFRDDGFRIAIARSIIGGKLANQRALLRRYTYRHPVGVSEAAERLLKLAMKTRTAGHGSLMGVEGAAAREYWAAFARLLPDGCGFTGRQRRPAPDPVNAALSLLYTLLTAETVGAVSACGLDPAVGVLHEARGSMPALAVDLVEEFRPLVVDTVVLEMARRGMLRPDTVTPHISGGVRFIPDTLKILFGRYEARMTTVFTHTPSGKKCSYRHALHLQARQIAACVRTGEACYVPTGWRT